MKATLSLVVLSLLALGAGAAQDTDADNLLAALREHYPNLAISSVSRTPVDGIFEVVAGKHVAYSDRGGRYFMYGSLVDMQTREDLTAARTDWLSRIDVAKLPLKDSFARVVGKGTRKLYVFSDPDCPYCRRLEPELAKLTDVTIYTFPFPIASLHSDAARKAEAIWCLADERGRAELWRRVVIDQEKVATKACANPIERNVALGESLGIQATPTLVAGDGRLLAGLADAGRIDAWLATPPHSVSQ